MSSLQKHEETSSASIAQRTASYLSTPTGEGSPLFSPTSLFPTLPKSDPALTRETKETISSEKAEGKIICEGTFPYTYEISLTVEGPNAQTELEKWKAEKRKDDFQGDSIVLISKKENLRLWIYLKENGDLDLSPTPLFTRNGLDIGSCARTSTGILIFIPSQVSTIILTVTKIEKIDKTLHSRSSSSSSSASSSTLSPAIVSVPSQSSSSTPEDYFEIPNKPDRRAPVEEEEAEGKDTGERAVTPSETLPLKPRSSKILAFVGSHKLLMVALVFLLLAAAVFFVAYLAPAAFAVLGALASMVTIASVPFPLLGIILLGTAFLLGVKAFIAPGATGNREEENEITSQSGESISCILRCLYSFSCFTLNEEENNSEHSEAEAGAEEERSSENVDQPSSCYSWVMRFFCCKNNDDELDKQLEEQRRWKSGAHRTNELHS